MALTLHQVAWRDGGCEGHRRGRCVTRSHYAGHSDLQVKAPVLPRITSLIASPIRTLAVAATDDRRARKYCPCFFSPYA